jgi:hypothetical protein
MHAVLFVLYFNIAMAVADEATIATNTMSITSVDIEIVIM